MVHASNPPVEEQKRAVIRDGALILYFDTAEIPSVARFDLDSLAQASFEIAAMRDNAYYITLRDFSGQTRDVARFSTKAEAHQALQSILHALLAERTNHGDRQQKPSSRNPVSQFLLRLLKWFVFLGLAAFLLYVVLLFVAFNSGQPPRQATATPRATTSPLARLPEGEAVDADSILPPQSAAPQTVAPALSPMTVPSLSSLPDVSSDNAPPATPTAQ